MDSVADFGAYRATLAITRSFQATGCDHLKRLERVNHNFPSLEDVWGAANDRLCKNVVARFLMKFWIKGEGRALAFDEAAASTHKVCCCFSLGGFSSFFLSLFMLLMILFILLADVALGCSGFCCQDW